MRAFGIFVGARCDVFSEGIAAVWDWDRHIHIGAESGSIFSRVSLT